MRKLIVILLFIPTVASGQLLTRDNSEVWSGGRNAIADNSGFTDYYYFFQNTRTINRLNGNITKVVLHATSVPTDSLIFEMWRYDGSAYDRIYREDIKGKVTEGVVDTITLDTPVAALDGDYVALKSVNGGSFGYVDYGLANSTIYGSEDIYLDGVDDVISDSLVNAFSYCLTIKLLGEAPLAVILGNSIAAGHPTNYSGVESSLANVPSNSIGNQLYQLDTDWVVQNMATGSTTSSYINDNFTEYVSALNPRYAIVESGVNDIATSVSKSTYIANMTEFLDSCEDNSIVPIIIKILPWTDGTNTQMQTRDDWMTDLEALVATYSGAYFIDMDTAMGEFRSGGDAGNLWDMQAAYAADGVHPNEAGYAKIAEVINTVVNTSASEGDIGGDYYVAPDGDDDAAGTYEAPWATFQKAFDVADAGDTVYFRGGVYLSTQINVIDPTGHADDVHGNSGTSRTNQVCYFNYPGETPILDCRYHCDSIPKLPGCDCIYNIAISLIQVEYVHFKGIEVRNVFLCDSNRVSGAISWDGAANMTFENMTVHDIGQRGYWGDGGAWDDVQGSPIFSSDSSYFINCDTYNICDTFVNNPGNAGDGLKLQFYEGNYYEFTGCRTWHFSDDGYDISGQGKRVFENCWSMPTTKYVEFDIEGNAYKTGAINPIYFDENNNATNFLIFRNCIAAFGTGTGFFELDYDPYRTPRGLYYNNLAWECGYGFRSDPETDTIETSIWRNNIAYGSTLQTAWEVPFSASIHTEAGMYTESNNSWDAVLQDGGSVFFVEATVPTVTSADWAVTDSATIMSQLTASRQSDGSLPVITFAHPVEGSDLIGAGYDVGMSSTPDIGIDWAYLGVDGEIQLTPVKKLYTISGVKQLYWIDGVPYYITVNE